MRRTAAGLIVQLALAPLYCTACGVIPRSELPPRERLDQLCRSVGLCLAAGVAFAVMGGLSVLAKSA